MNLALETLHVALRWSNKRAHPVAQNADNGAYAQQQQSSRRNSRGSEGGGVRGGGRWEGSATTTSQINCKHGKKAAPGEMKRLVK